MRIADLQVLEEKGLERKRCRLGESDQKIEEEDSIKHKEAQNGAQKQGKEKNNAKPAEPPKDYIHVRARRGQATDSHSLAERVQFSSPLCLSQIPHFSYVYSAGWITGC